RHGHGHFFQRQHGRTERRRPLPRQHCRQHRTDHSGLPAEPPRPHSRHSPVLPFLRLHRRPHASRRRGSRRRLSHQSSRFPRHRSTRRAVPRHFSPLHPHVSPSLHAPLLP